MVEAGEKLESKLKSAKHKIGGTGLGINLLHSDKSADTLASRNSTERPASMRSMRNGEPLVLHGWTLTAPVGFRDVCKTIRETAFQTSNLPVIVSLEVHANLEQQEVMVNIMKEEWKGYLVDEAQPTCNPEERLPRLEELLNKILIKVKKASTQQQTPQMLEARASSTNLAPVPSRNDGESGGSASEDERSTKKKVKICESLSNLGIYTHSEHFVSFEANSSKKPSHIFSIGEGQIMDLHEKKRDAMFEHNRDYFMRAYPAGFRIDSSNLDPSSFWRKGIQMVALNWQKCDEGVMLNEAMFSGESGWVLKPPGYRSESKDLIPFKTVHLKITIYSGQHIPIPEGQDNKGFHPSIRCELHAEKPEDKTAEGVTKVKGGEWKHRTPHAKGDNPDWGKDGVVLDFPLVDGILEELSFVRYVISAFRTRHTTAERFDFRNCQLCGYTAETADKRGRYLAVGSCSGVQGRVFLFLRA
jgi:phosphatidylinositol phospholipase C delta